MVVDILSREDLYIRGSWSLQLQMEIDMESFDSASGALISKQETKVVAWFSGLRHVRIYLLYLRSTCTSSRGI
jgi:hypothetical protein